MFSRIISTKCVNYRNMCYAASSEIIPNLPWEKFQSLSHRKRLNLYLNSQKHIQDIKFFIPKKYFEQKNRTLADNLYLIDSRIARDIAKSILPLIKDKNAMICETNAGMGFLTTELLEGGIGKIRLYETCSEFRLTLKEFSNEYPGKVELFVKDLFHIWKMSYLDKLDKGCRVMEFLKGVPKRNWGEEPVMIIIGPMPKLEFLAYMFKMISLQNEIVTYGRIELFVIMRPSDYLKVTAGPHCDLHTYQMKSVLANTFCRFRIIEKYPRIAFLPWEAGPRQGPYTRSFNKHDVDSLYLVHIEFKEELPMRNEQLLPFYFFLKQMFGKGRVPLVPKLEKWISGIGRYIILPEKPENISSNIDMFTKSGDLTPAELLEVFKILYNHPGYSNSPLTASVELEVLKYETVGADYA